MNRKKEYFNVDDVKIAEELGFYARYYSMPNDILTFTNNLNGITYHITTYTNKFYINTKKLQQEYDYNKTISENKLEKNYEQLVVDTFKDVLNHIFTDTCIMFIVQNDQNKLFNIIKHVEVSQYIKDKYEHLIEANELGLI